MTNLLTNEVFIGFLGTAIGGLFTYLGIKNKNSADTAGIYTKEIRELINNLKEQNKQKEEEITRLENLCKNLKDQLETSLELIDKLQDEREIVENIIAKKDKQIDTLTKLVNVLRKN